MVGDLMTCWRPTSTAGAVAMLSLALLASCATSGGGTPGTGGGQRSGSPSDWAALAPLNALATAILYHQAAEGVPPDDALALAMPGVCDGMGAESRREVLDVTWARLKEMKVQVLERRSWLVAQQLSLGGFDRQRGGFPTLLTRDSGPRFGSTDFCGYPDLIYAVALVNWRSFSVIRLSEERALQFVRGNGLRSVTQELEVEVEGVESAPVPTLLVRLVRLRVSDVVTGELLVDTGLR
jgi:hypothetical protein